MTATKPGRPAPDALDPGGELDALEQERDFLLRSLEDLDAERDAGDIDETDYQILKDDYTARTALVLRAITAAKAPRGPRTSGRAAAADGAAEPPAMLARAERGRRRWRLAAVVTVVAVFASVAGWAVTRSSGSRIAGQSVSGDNQAIRSGGIDPRLLQASQLVNKGKVADALKVYDRILKDHPNQPQALANEGWLVAQAGLAANRADLVDAGLVRIDRAEKIDSAYNAVHFFRGYLLLEAKNDPIGAVTELRTYLGGADPSGPEIPQVEQLLQTAISRAGPKVPPGPNAASGSAGPPASPTPASRAARPGPTKP